MYISWSQDPKTENGNVIRPNLWGDNWTMLSLRSAQMKSTLPGAFFSSLLRLRLGKFGDGGVQPRCPTRGKLLHAQSCCLLTIRSD
jgi:hypothetical protein